VRRVPLAVLAAALACRPPRDQREFRLRIALVGPLNALAHLVRVLAGQPRFAPLASGEIVTTGTITDAWPVKRDETWQSHYGSLGVEGVQLRFT